MACPTTKSGHPSKQCLKCLAALARMGHGLEVHAAADDIGRRHQTGGVVVWHTIEGKYKYDPLCRRCIRTTVEAL